MVELGYGDINRSRHQRYSIKKVLLKILQNSLEKTCVRVSVLISYMADTRNLIKKDTFTQAFSCEFCEIFKNTFL